MTLVHYAGFRHDGSAGNGAAHGCGDRRGYDRTVRRRRIRTVAAGTLAAVLIYPDTYLDSITGPDVVVSASVVGGPDTVSFRISGDIPGLIYLQRDVSDLPQIWDMVDTDVLDQVTRHLQTQITDLHRDDVTWHDDPIAVAVGSRQGETLGDWADRIGLKAATALAGVKLG